MPVCPHCGHDTPDPDARFCAACGRSLAPDAPGDAESAAEATSVFTSAASQLKRSSPLRPSASEGDADAGGHRATPDRHRAARGRDEARHRVRASCWTPTSRPQGVIPTATSFSTTSRCRVTMPSSPERVRASGCETWAA